MNETHHWIASNGGHEMAMTIAGNVGKSRGGGARSMEVTNAPLPGEDSVAEQTWHAWSKFAEGKSRDSGMYYDSVESPPVDLSDPDQLRAGILAARGDADWLDVEWIVSTIYSGHMPRSRSQRMFLNQLVTAEDQLICPEDWDNCAVDDRLEDGDAITLGFDGGRTDDATALVAIRVPDRLIVPLGVWEKPDGPAGDGWQVDRATVDDAVRNAMERYDVQAFHADVALWESYVDAWSEDYRGPCTSSEACPIEQTQCLGFPLAVGQEGNPLSFPHPREARRLAARSRSTSASVSKLTPAVLIFVSVVLPPVVVTVFAPMSRRLPTLTPAWFLDLRRGPSSATAAGPPKRTRTVARAPVLAASRVRFMSGSFKGADTSMNCPTQERLIRHHSGVVDSHSCE
ncbi:hypothetical protein [Streptomyces sp. NPDC050355]|uniref:hypothetical protein n=1 Tax=Streptomyces sp. NPDC050355 TaxID=3365609 RepID=UPI0037A66DEE